LAENSAPIIADLHRCIDGKDGRRLLADQDELRDALAAARGRQVDPETRATVAVVEARRRGLVGDGQDLG
jgi:type IV secretion system protein VirD4